MPHAFHFGVISLVLCWDCLSWIDQVYTGLRNFGILVGYSESIFHMTEIQHRPNGVYFSIESGRTENICDHSIGTLPNISAGCRPQRCLCRTSGMPAVLNFKITNSKAPQNAHHCRKKDETGRGPANLCSKQVVMQSALTSFELDHSIPKKRIVSDRPIARVESSIRTRTNLDFAEEV
jgi:hypothetical protein